MKSRLHRLEIRNFKAFRDFTVAPEGRHLLVYGSNGSGKSSLYWALYTFLQSARKAKHEVAKYFEPAGVANLLNIHEQKDAAPRPGEIAVTLRDTTTKAVSTFQISEAMHGTHKQPIIEKGDLASDFITYRFFFGFSHFRNSDRYNLWPLFEKEILPFCVSTSGHIPLDAWSKIRSGRGNPTKARGAGGTRAYASFKANTETFAAILPGIVDSINTEAQKFYDAHFAADDPTRIEIKLGVTVAPKYDVAAKTFTPPEIGFVIKVGTDVINRPQVFLNEAKLTQLALSIRFAASLVNLHESDLKLLVLDDLLVSLDMSNRMKVVEIVLSDTFANYQKIILTHELGFFEEVRRTIGVTHSDWVFAKLTGDAKRGPQVKTLKSDLEAAQDYLANDQLAECGNRLRKCAEASLESFIRSARVKRGLDPLFTDGRFSSLANRIAEAKNLIALTAHTKLADLLQSHFSDVELSSIVSADEIDPAKFAAATKKEKGRIIARLMSAKAGIQQGIVDLLSESSRKQQNAIRILDDVANIKDRILNPASHAGITPLYTKEAEDAVSVIQRLEAALAAALPTL